MHPQWTTRPVDAPADNLMTAEQVCKLFGFGVSTLERLVRSGEFPEGIAVSPGTKVWDWKAVAYYQLRCEMRPRLRAAGGEQAASGGEQSAST